ncbi:MAG: protein-L-isoaspartate(D-aspartate) O-methyltransferase [Chitinophagales bacterium]|nr:protein-L-isoaspartate(D-aspartate) O-methyltransferase [Chitinophagales bacterium]
MKDTYRDKGLRKELVQLLEKKGISDHKVLAAMEKVARHLFFKDSVFHKVAYKDKAFPIGFGQTISQPYTVAYQTQLLEINKGDKVLEIGTGSGYQAAIINELGGRVYSIERQQGLFERTKKLLIDMGYSRIKLFFGDGFGGLPAFAPFDKIIITAAAPEIPKALKEQLKVGGLMVIPLGDGDFQRMLRLKKTSEDEFDTEEFERFSFVPMLKGKQYS